MTERFCLLRQIFAERFLSKSARYFRRRALCGVNVGLHFANCDWPLCQTSIRVKNRAIRIFPALVSHAAGRSARVFDKSVTIDVAVIVDPIQREFDVWPNQ